MLAPTWECRMSIGLPGQRASLNRRSQELGLNRVCDLGFDRFYSLILNPKIQIQHCLSDVTTVDCSVLPWTARNHLHEAKYVRQLYAIRYVRSGWRVHSTTSVMPDLSKKFSDAAAAPAM